MVGKKFSNTKLVQNRACISWTWYVASDFHFYAISPIFTSPLYKKPDVGIALLVVATVLSILFVFVSSDLYKTDPNRNLGSFIKNIGNTSDIQNDWIVNERPGNRLCLYAIGMLLGYFVFKKPSRTFHTPVYIRIIDWSLDSSTSFLVLCGLCDYIDDGNTFPSQSIVAALYTCFSRSVWSFCVCWGLSGLHLRICLLHRQVSLSLSLSLSLQFWLPLSKITYVAYLTNFLLISMLFNTRNFLITCSLVRFSQYYLTSVVFKFPNCPCRVAPGWNTLHGDWKTNFEKDLINCWKISEFHHVSTFRIEFKFIEKLLSNDLLQTIVYRTRLKVKI